MTKTTKLTAKDFVAMLDCHERLPSLTEIEKEFVIDDALMSLIIEYWVATDALLSAKRKIRILARESPLFAGIL